MLIVVRMLFCCQQASKNILAIRAKRQDSLRKSGPEPSSAIIPSNRQVIAAKPAHLSNLRQAPERPRKTREECRATPGAMRSSVVCLVVWPELWLTRGDPRLGKRPLIESIALSPYTPISPGALLAYATPQSSSSLSCSSSKNLHANSRTQGPCRQTFHRRQSTQQPISSYQLHHEPATDSPFPLSLGGQQSTPSIGSTPYLSNRSPYCRSAPQTAGILQTATIFLAALLYSSNPLNRRRKSIRVSSRSRDHQHRRQIYTDRSHPHFHAVKRPPRLSVTISQHDGNRIRASCEQQPLHHGPEDYSFTTPVLLPW